MPFETEINNSKNKNKNLNLSQDIQDLDSDNNLTIGRYSFKSRLIVGTGKYPDFKTMQKAIELSGAEIITVAVRRIDFNAKENMLSYIDQDKYTLLPNTAGCYTAEDAVNTLRLARELEVFKTDLVKLEVIGDQKTLYPDNEELLKAARILVKDGFTVMPYMIDDPVVAKKLEDIGCPVVMPLASPIGSGLGIRNPYNLMIIKEVVSVPVIVDAGVGTASDAAKTMELGVDGILMNTAIAGAGDPLKMAIAMNYAVKAGRLAYLAGRIPMKLYAQASTQLEGIVF
jgi:thiazole synthase